MRIHSEFFYEYNIFIVHLVFPLSYPNFVKIRFFSQLTLFLLSRAMHKLLTYFSLLKPCEMTTFYRENI